MPSEDQRFYNRLYYELNLAYQEARKGKRGTRDEHVFDVGEAMNLAWLAEDLINKTYAPSRGIAFVVFRPVIREIFAASFRDRVIHHWLFDKSYEWWDRRFITDSYSCRHDKGPQYGVERMQLMMKRAESKWPGQEIYCVKFDIQGYFMSLPRKELYKRVVWGLNRQYPNGGREVELIKFVWGQVIFDDPTHNVRIRGIRSDAAKVPDTKSLFRQPPGQGIVIGNLSSQLLSNIYLDQLDRFMKYTLKYEFYGRYVDDFYVLVPKSRLKQTLRDKDAIANYLMGLKLTLHPNKTKVIKIQDGVPFLGMLVFPNRIFPGRRLRHNFRRAAYRVSYGLESCDSITSYLGFMIHTNSDHIVQKMFDYFGWEYMAMGSRPHYEKYVKNGVKVEKLFSGSSRERER